MQKPEYRTRWVEAALESRASRGKVRLLLGARQTGKSRLVRHLAPSDAVWVDLQDRRERLRFERTPGLLVAELEARKGRATVCVDEVQKVPGVLDDVRAQQGSMPLALAGSGLPGLISLLERGEPANGDPSCR